MLEHPVTDTAGGGGEVGCLASQPRRSVCRVRGRYVLGVNQEILGQAAQGQKSWCLLSSPLYLLATGCSSICTEPVVIPGKVSVCSLFSLNNQRSNNHISQTIPSQVRGVILFLLKLFST